MKKISSSSEHLISEHQFSVKEYLKLARFDHWIKQLFILPGIVFALVLVGNRNETFFLKNMILGFIATCFIASANYIINEWLDLEFDQFHPTKKYRSAVVNELKPMYVYIEYAIFSSLGFLFSVFLPRPVLMVEACLWIMGIVYNVRPLRTKEIPYIDVLSESVNNALRFLIGWFIVTSLYFPPITVVFGFWMGGAFLMATKRYSEYRMINDPVSAALYRKSFAKYTEKSLLISAFYYALLSVFFCGIFMIKYKIELLLSIPVLCGLFSYYLHISYKTDSAAQKPEKLFHERGLMLFASLFIILLCVLMLIKLPLLSSLLNASLIGA